jgi:hypothetical protein
MNVKKTSTFVQILTKLESLIMVVSIGPKATNALMQLYKEVQPQDLGKP